MDTGRNDPCPCDSGRKYKRCCGKPESEKPASSKELDDALSTILGFGSEPLTDSKIEELVGEGWPEEDLQAAQEQGARFNPERQSLVFPAQTNF